jgi:nitrate reductase NapE component
VILHVEGVAPQSTGPIGPGSRRRNLGLVFLFLVLCNFVVALVSVGGDAGFVVLGIAFIAGAAYFWFRLEC